MTGSEHHEGSAGSDPLEPGGRYPEFPPYPAEHEQPRAPEPAAMDPEGTGPATPATRASAAGSSASAETHPQPAMLPGLEFDPDPDAGSRAPAQPPAPPFGAAFAAAGSLLAPPDPAPAPEEAEPSGSPPRRMRLRFRTWRRSRPFWGGLFVVLGGGEILFTEKAPLRVIVHFGLTGLAGYLIPSVMVLCGVLLVFNPAQRMFYSILSVLLALATWPTSNLGGFLFGMLFGLIGGSLAFAWMPASQAPQPKAAKHKPPKAPAHG